MRTRRQVLATVATMTVLAGCSAETNEETTAASLFVPSFSEGTIPEQHTCDGAGSSPEIEISDVSRETESLALIVDDIDAPSPEPYVYWLVWNIPPNTRALPEGIPQRPTVSPSERRTDPGFPEGDPSGPIEQGTNSADEVGYTAPCPPNEGGTHTYEFTLYSLNAMLDLEPGATRGDLESAMETERRGSTTLTATYER